MNLLDISKLTLRIGAFEALKGIDLSVNAREIRALVGESGSTARICLPPARRTCAVCAATRSAWCFRSR
jgi:ABC-type antimicrobial peptide transport system ATPase subunit